MSNTYSSLDELYKAFDAIEKPCINKIGAINKGWILHNFEKEKLRLMAEQIATNIRCQNIEEEQSKQQEIENLSKTIVIRGE